MCFLLFLGIAIHLDGTKSSLEVAVSVIFGICTKSSKKTPCLRELIFDPENFFEGLFPESDLALRCLLREAQRLVFSASRNHAPGIVITDHYTSDFLLYGT